MALYWYIPDPTVYMGKLNILYQLLTTVPIAEILSGKNGRAWVSMVLYLKK